MTKEEEKEEKNYECDILHITRKGANINCFDFGNKCKGAKMFTMWDNALH